MRSGTSFYNSGLGRNTLRRCWPIWVIWLSALLFSLPVSIAGEISRILKQGTENAAAELSYRILQKGLEASGFALVFCPFAVLILFSFLYTARGSGMIASLPIKRESVFFTVCLVGLVPMLLCELITALTTLCVGSGSGLLDADAVWKWLWMVSTGTVAFYGISLFCAMLTGSFVIMPFAYLGLNLAPYFAYTGICSTAEAFIYGFSYRESSFFTRMSPIAGLNTISIARKYEYLDGIYVPTGVIETENLELLGYYCIAGVVFAVIALLLFRRRRMESAGDIIAVPVLRPVFKYCVTLAGACLFALIMDSMLFCDLLDGTGTGIALIFCLVIGAFVGYYAAEMLINRSVKVFSGNRKGFLLSVLIIVLLGLSLELDLFGFEKHIPGPDMIDSVSVDYGYGNTTEFRESENIEKILSLHSRLIEDKRINEQTPDQTSQYIDHIGIRYTLKNGREVFRFYYIPRNVGGQDELNPALYALDDVINVPEAIEARIGFPEGCGYDNIDDCIIYGYYVEPNTASEDTPAYTRRTDQHFVLTREQAIELYRDCIVPDAKDGHMVRLWPLQDGEYESTRSTLYISYSFERTDNMTARRSKDYVVYLDAERCCTWIEENTDLRLQSIGESE